MGANPKPSGSRLWRPLRYRAATLLLRLGRVNVPNVKIKQTIASRACQGTKTRLTVEAEGIKLPTLASKSQPGT